MIGALFATVGLSEFVLNEELRPSPHIAAYYQTWSAEAGPLLDETLVNLPIGLTKILWPSCVQISPTPAIST